MSESNIRKFNIAVFSAVLLLAVFLLGTSVGASRIADIDKVTNVDNKELGMPSNVDFSSFWRVWNALNEKHVGPEEITDQEKIWMAIQGLTRSMRDPYTIFLPPQEAQHFRDEISGNFQGVGMEIGIRDDVLTVIAPLRNTPAERAGVVAGDKILEINGENAITMSADQAARLIRGPKGTAVSLLLFREGVDEPIELEIFRDIIDIPTLETEMIEGGIFMIELYNFSAVSPELFRVALRDFINSGSSKLIIDLRNNPGGYLEAAVDIASWFLPQGKAIVREEFKEGSERVYRSKGYNVFSGRNIDVVVLINEGSASASEIVAGALREHGIAELVGEQTFGKGSVQELVEITENTYLKVTVAKWLTPNGVSISAGGLMPDHEILISAEDREANIDSQLQKAIEILNNR